MNYKIAVLPGDGIGPEVTTEAIKVLDAVAHKYKHTFVYEYADVGAIAIDNTGTPLPDMTLDICTASDAILFGAIGDPKYDNDPSAKVRPEQGLLQLRKALGLYCNIRPMQTYTDLLAMSPLKEAVVEGTDFVIYRELTGGLYFGEKTLSADGTAASDLCTYSSEEIERITHQAFAAAQKRNKKVTLVDKANVLESSRLWRKVVSQISEAYPDIELNFLFVDNAAMQIILNPKQFDVILTENLFGDILSDEASVIGGSIGLLASASTGDEHGLFEPIHGSYPQAKGKGIANPIASILSTAMMLDYLGLDSEADDVREAVRISINARICTPDINETNKNITTSEVGSYIVTLISDEINSAKHIGNILVGQSTII